MALIPRIPFFRRRQTQRSRPGGGRKGGDGGCFDEQQEARLAEDCGGKAQGQKDADRGNETRSAQPKWLCHWKERHWAAPC